MKGEKNLQSLLKRDIILSIMTRQKRKYAIVDLEATSAGSNRSEERRVGKECRL